MNVAEWIKVYPHAVPPVLCDEWIALYENATEHVEHAADYRRCKAFTGIDKTQHFAALKSTVRRCFDRYKAETRASVLGFVSMLESVQIFKYDPATTEPERFHPHADAWSMQTASRQLSLIMYLNDVAEGGETSFPALGIDVKPAKGTALVFPSSFVFMHEGKPPLSGPKYIAVSWLHFSGEGHGYRCHPL